MKTILLCSVVILSSVAQISASPKKYLPEDNDFRPSNRYYESNLPEPNKNSDDAQAKISKDNNNDRLRFGVPVTYGNTGNGAQYGGNNGVGYSMKIDIGGIALGALIGLGAILIIPKLANVFAGAHGYRSIENDMSSLTEALARIDNSLEQHDIDSSSCMQRIICTYVNEAQKNIDNNESNATDEFIVSLTSNPLISHMFDGTAIKEAIEMGRRGDIEKCSSLSQKCTLTRENLIKVIASLLPA